MTPSKAYLVGFLDVTGDYPVYIGCAIYSDDKPTSRTGHVAFTIIEVHGNSYDEAARTLRGLLLTSPYFQWARRTCHRQ